MPVISIQSTHHSHHNNTNTNPIMSKSTFLTTLLMAALLVSTATAHPHPYPRELPPDNPKATLTYANNAGTVELSVQGTHDIVAKACKEMPSDQGVVYAEVLTRYVTWNQRQAYHLVLFPSSGCKERDPATGEYLAAARILTYDGQGQELRDENGKAFVPKSYGLQPAYRV
ncbi:hypothetical protein BCR44DRAFT_85969 [Catenaria anguillulae PL171]|uniref:Uncharacterized protein n=1 Tax=Catenaria anguillulae PL171 TaxID=765915 RepID=A0A1Y2HRW7_9FUNG|nr:hypothetical protein BCR44DRAFT_85969 [Catenaria anguillulae PL171]